MTVRFRLLVKPRVRRQLAGLEQAAASQPGSLRDRELRASSLAFEPSPKDVRRISAVSASATHPATTTSAIAPSSRSRHPESRYGHDLGPSHRLIYREFEPEDGGLPYREVVCFEPRHADRPFEVAGCPPPARGRPSRTRHSPTSRTIAPAFGRGAAEPTGPPRLPLPPDLRRALAAASDVAPVSRAVNQRRTHPVATRNPRPQRPGWARGLSE